MSIETVLGPVDAGELDFVSMHEHVFGDFRGWYTPGTDAHLAHQDVRMENLGFLHWNPVGIADNLILDDERTAIEELSLLGPTPINAILDLTNINIGRNVAAMPAISRAAGVHILAATGFYIEESLPDWLDERSDDQLYELLRDELVEGIDGTGIRPAIIGEIGTSERISPRERRVLLASGRAAPEVGVCVNVHLDPRGRNAIEVVEVLTGAGLPAGDVVLSHMQNVLDDWAYHLAVADTGAVLEYDSFGEESYYGDLGFALPRDTDKMDLTRRLVEAGHADQLVFGSDIWLKARMCRYGGLGYAHLPSRILPELERMGVSAEALRQIMHTTPIRILDRSAREPVRTLRAVEAAGI